MKTIDLNCDMGESFGTYVLGYDEMAMPFVTSVNVACGFHASDPVVMSKTVKNAVIDPFPSSFPARHSLTQDSGMPSC